MKIHWFNWLAGSLALGGALVLRPTWHLWQAHRRDVPAARYLPAGQATDFSPYSATAVAQAIDVAPDTAATLAQLWQVLAGARARHLPVAIAGARHSQGGHTLAAGGIQLNWPQMPAGCAAAPGPRSAPAAGA